MRYWRALKALGCGALRDGVYLLPAGEVREAALRELAAGIVESGGVAQVLHADNRDTNQDLLFRQLFDRSQEHADFLRSLLEARKKLPALEIAETERLRLRLHKEYDALVAMDYFPGESSAQGQAAWDDFQVLLNSYLSPDEPRPSDGTIRRLDREEYQQRNWATRQGLWVDRVASAWLIRRFIDGAPKFLWLKTANDCPREALGFDFDGAAFTHVGDLVTFQVLAQSFGLDRDRGVARLGELVASLDTGAGEVPEAPGFEALMRAARQRGLDDDRMLAEMSVVLDSFYEFYAGSPAGDKQQ
jgi:hypothetical protein